MDQGVKARLIVESEGKGFLYQPKIRYSGNGIQWLPDKPKRAEESKEKKGPTGRASE